MRTEWLPELAHMQHQVNCYHDYFSRSWKVQDDFQLPVASFPCFFPTASETSTQAQAELSIASSLDTCGVLTKYCRRAFCETPARPAANIPRQIAIR